MSSSKDRLINKSIKHTVNSNYSTSLNEHKDVLNVTYSDINVLFFDDESNWQIINVLVLTIMHHLSYIVHMKYL